MQLAPGLGEGDDLPRLPRRQIRRGGLWPFDQRQQTHEVRRRISLTGQYASVDEDLTGLENLILIGIVIQID